MEYSQIATSENRESRYGQGHHPEAVVPNSRHEATLIRTPSRYDRGPSFLEKSTEHIQRTPSMNVLNKPVGTPLKANEEIRISGTPAGITAENRRNNQPVQPKTLK